MKKTKCVCKEGEKSFVFSAKLSQKPEQFRSNSGKSDLTNSWTRMSPVAWLTNSNKLNFFSQYVENSTVCRSPYNSLPSNKWSIPPYIEAIKHFYACYLQNLIHCSYKTRLLFSFNSYKKIKRLDSFVSSWNLFFLTLFHISFLY